MKFLFMLHTKSKHWLNNKFSAFSVASTIDTHDIHNNISHIAKIDSGATQNYIKNSHQHLLQNTTQLTNGPIAMLPNQTTIRANSVGILPLHNSLSTKAQTAYSFPNLTNESLLSVGQICDDNCEVIFDKHNVRVIKNNKVIITGHRSPLDKLYDIDLNNQPKYALPQKSSIHKMNYIIRKDKSKTEQAQYLHACAFSPSMSTFTQAIKNGNFVTWP